MQGLFTEKFSRAQWKRARRLSRSTGKSLKQIVANASSLARKDSVNSNGKSHDVICRDAITAAAATR